MFDWVENRLMAKGLKYWAHSFPVHKLSQEKTQPENMCGMVFEKAISRGGKVNKTSVYVEGTVWRVL